MPSTSIVPLGGQGCQPRNSIEDIYGARTPYKHEWPSRLDEHTIEEPERWVQSACVLCSNGCGMDIGVAKGKVVGVRGRVVDRVNKGRLGPKGLNASLTIHHKDRLTHPLIRKEGKLERATWEEAMSLIVQRTKSTIERLTAHGIAFYTSGQLFLEEYYALAMIGKAGLNTLHMDGNTRLCTATAAASMRESWGSDGQAGSYTDIDHTHCILMVGHNMAATQTVLWARVLDRLRGPDPPQLIVVDPRRSASAKQATVHLAPRIGTNMALLNGIQYLLFKNDWINQDFLEKHCVGLQELRAKVQKYTPAFVESITHVPAADLERAAKIIGTTESLLSTCLQGVYQSNQATASACQVNNINLLTGCIGRPGSGVFQMNGQPTAQNNREAGCDGEFPAFRNGSNPNHMQELADIWNIDYNKVPHWGLPTHVQNILKYIDNGTIQMLWVSGTNPLVSLPNLHQVRELFSKQSLFLVVQDIFPTETTELADVVLPAAQWGEKTGCFTNVDRTVHLSHKAVDPPGEAKSDFEIFVDFARRMDFRNKDNDPLMPWNDPKDAFEAWQRMSSGRPCDYSALTYEKLTGGSGIQWPCNETHPEGKERLYDDGIFYTDTEYCESFGHDLETGTPLSKSEYQAINPAGRAILKACHYMPASEEPSEEYPLQLSTGRNVYHFHTRTKTGRSKPLQDAFSEPVIHINAEDAAAFDVIDGDQVVVSSRRGKVQMKASVGDISRSQCFIPFHFGYFDAVDERARAANELTTEEWDVVSKQPLFKAGAIRIEKVTDSQVHAEQEQRTFQETMSSAKPNALDFVVDERPRQRHLELWLGAAYASIQTLIEAFEDLLPFVKQDKEVHSGLRLMQRLVKDAEDALAPMIQKYSTELKYGHDIAQALRTSLFPSGNTPPSSYGTMVALTGVLTYMANIDAHLTALVPVSQALWDEEFIQAVGSAKSFIERTQKWVQHQLTVRSAQTLVVPSTDVITSQMQWIG